jgi:hypothetical protein
MEGDSPVVLRAGVKVGVRVGLEVKSGGKSSDIDIALELRRLWRGVDSFFRDLKIGGLVTYLSMTFRFIYIINIRGASKIYIHMYTHIITYIRIFIYTSSVYTVVQIDMYMYLNMLTYSYT